MRGGSPLNVSFIKLFCTVIVHHNRYSLRSLVDFLCIPLLVASLENHLDTFSDMTVLVSC